MKEKSFEVAFRRLESIVQKIEDGELALEESIKLYEEGIQLWKLCDSKLEKAKSKIEKLVKQESGSLSAEPFDPDQGADEQGAG